MTLLTCEFDAGTVREWHATTDGVETRTTDDYAPRLYVAGPEDALTDLAATLVADPKVQAVDDERWYLDLDRRERERVLAVTLDRVGEVRTLAHEIRHLHEDGAYTPGTYRLFNVDFEPGFRYCVETGTPPVPERDLETLSVSLPTKALADGDLTAMTVDGESAGETTAHALETLHERIHRTDPDVLLCSSAQLLALCRERARKLGFEAFQLGRRPGFEQLAGESTFESYGQVGHSPARFDVPGRAVVDRSNSFLLAESGLAGLLDLAERSWRPLQETAWASIGTILTAIQCRTALERDVLIPWNKWRPEEYKTVETLHRADRGGFTFAPDVGVHEDVVEVDFASLYPRIMCEHNVSPETVGCDCPDCRERTDVDERTDGTSDDVPGLGYTVCDRDGFVPDVLRPILDDRAEIKRELRAADDPDRIADLEARSSALKWILVSCFGYQGYRNAKFGRIECHEAINAFAREILLDAKDRLEAGGWRVVHGIVDSLWVQAVADDPEPLSSILPDISEAVGIELELENRFSWVAFAPMRGSDAGALTRYFGTVAGEDEYKLRGIEARQRSTPAFVEDVQRDLLRELDRHLSAGASDREVAEAVCDRLARALARLRSGDVDASDLLIRQRVSKPLAAYDRYTHAVAALERAADRGLERQPGQDVRYVVVADTRRSPERVRLDFEDPDDYDADYYRDLLVRAGESVVSPLGWDRQRIETYLADGRDLRLAAFQ
ncbi:type B DNA-directed DNA polymerase [Haloarculaceae archaeon H-GB2-1]|nr:type B DNA-directed DNA polymerase [Haloarculaceae archaeon H-GB1-1]MEA5386959.1 type B DNA-directed DNA polymerase [Haloarculaceae archaeon H-GB11]MEA5408463.1 type B DNA-directed DNA polymerase [Haloarculaceae archaeon H-GB2-1]